MDKLKSFFKLNQIHFLAIGIFLLVCLFYFSSQLGGNSLRQHDVEMGQGASHESSYYYEKTGKQALWTNSMFGGMPTTQIHLDPNTNFIAQIVMFSVKLLGHPISLIFWTMLGAYIGLSLMKINKWVCIFGALTLSLMSYNIIIYTAGHNAKIMAFAFMLPLFGAFWYTYRTNWKWGAILSSIFMAFEIYANHIQMTYYFSFLLLAIGISEFIRALKNNQFLNFSKATIALLVAFSLGILVNSSSILSTKDYMKFTTRGENDLLNNQFGEKVESKAGLDKNYILQYSNQIEESYTLISPYVKGVGDFSITAGESSFTDKASDFSEAASSSPIYWGENPIVYVGILTVFLAFLAFFYVKDFSKWFFLGIAILCLMLSWGKFYEDLSNWFIQNVPLYNKFRATTVIVMVVQIILIILSCLSVQSLINNKEEIRLKSKKFLIICGSFFLIVVIALNTQDFKLYSDREKATFEKDESTMIQENISRILSTPDDQLVAQNIDKTNKEQVYSIAQNQVLQYQEAYQSILNFRKDLVSYSNMRTLLILVLGIILLCLFIFNKISNWIAFGLLGCISFFDISSVSRNYINDSESLYVDPNDVSKSRNLSEDYRFYKSYVHRLYPLKPNQGDLSIMAMELEENKSLKPIIDNARKEGVQKANEISDDYNDQEHIKNAYAFAALNMNTNYRVLDLTDNTFSSATASYFHKSLGGYHGAKLRNIQNLIDQHISYNNNSVLDMLNIKYIIQQSQEGIVASPNKTNCGNAWFVKKVKSVKDSDAEIRGLGKQIKIVNAGKGHFFVNGVPKQSAVIFGLEKLQYVDEGASDTIPVQLSNGIPVGVDVSFVKDINGKTNLIMKQGVDADTTNSFKSLVDIKVLSEFKPKEVALMNNDFYSKLNKKEFSGEGSIKMVNYSPNKITYKSNSKEGGLAVFSEIYYPIGWIAKVNGKEVSILKADYLLRALELPKGNCTVEFVYDEKKYENYKLISLIASIILFAAFAAGIYFRKFAKKETN